MSKKITVNATFNHEHDTLNEVLALLDRRAIDWEITPETSEECSNGDLDERER